MGGLRKAIPLSQAADDLSLSKDFVRDLIRKGEIEAFKAGGTIRLYVDSLERYLDRQTIKPRPAPTQNPERPARGRQRSAQFEQALDGLARLGITV